MGWLTRRLHALSWTPTWTCQSPRLSSLWSRPRLPLFRASSSSWTQFPRPLAATPTLLQWTLFPLPIPVDRIGFKVILVTQSLPDSKRYYYYSWLFSLSNRLSVKGYGIWSYWICGYCYDYALKEMGWKTNSIDVKYYMLTRVKKMNGHDWNEIGFNIWKCCVGKMKNGFILFFFTLFKIRIQNASSQMMRG